MINWIKKKYRAVKRAIILKVVVKPFEWNLGLFRTLRDATDSVVEAFNNVVYWSLDVIRDLKDAAK